MTKYLILIVFFWFNSAYGLTISGDSSVTLEAGQSGQANLTFTAGASPEEVVKIFIASGTLVGGGAACIKSYTASETCSLSISKVLDVRYTSKIYVYLADGTMVTHLINFNILDYHKNLAAGLRAEIFGQVAVDNKKDLGAFSDISSDIGFKVHIRNIQNKDTQPLSSASVEVPVKLINDGCVGKILKRNDFCILDLAISNTGVQFSGNYASNIRIGTASFPNSYSVEISSSLTMPELIAEIKDTYNENTRFDINDPSVKIYKRYRDGILLLTAQNGGTLPQTSQVACIGQRLIWNNTYNSCVNPGPMPGSGTYLVGSTISFDLGATTEPINTWFNTTSYSFKVIVDTNDLPNYKVGASGPTLLDLRLVHKVAFNVEYSGGQCLLTTSYNSINSQPILKSSDNSPIALQDECEAIIEYSLLNNQFPQP